MVGRGNEDFSRRLDINWKVSGAPARVPIADVTKNPTPPEIAGAIDQAERLLLKSSTVMYASPLAEAELRLRGGYPGT
jgi:hypothetical protein